MQFRAIKILTKKILEARELANNCDIKLDLIANNAQNIKDFVSVSVLPGK